MSARLQASRASRPSDAELISAREFLPGQWLQTYRAPSLAASLRPGQYLQVDAPIGWGVPMRRPVTVHSVDRGRGEVSVHLDSADPATTWLSTVRPSENVALLGPLGRPVRVDPRSHQLLLIAEGPAVAGLRFIADEALTAGRRVTLLLGAHGAAEVYPSSLLPDEVEYVVATDDGSVGHVGSVVDLVTRYEAWADQAFAAGPPAMLATLARLAAGREKRLGVARLGRRGGRAPARGSQRARPRSWLQVLLPQRVGCALGVCLGCVVMGSDGPTRVCREGPVYEVDELTWDDPT